MVNPSSDEIAGEHALRDGEVDRLGFGEMADRIAISIVDRASKDGLVIGLDGEWGSGKSSLIHLIERALNKLSKDKPPTVINFRPWLVGDRDALLQSLFSELAEKIARANYDSGDATRLANLKAKEVAERLIKFGRALGKAGELIEAADLILPGAKHAGKAVSGLGKLFAREKKSEDGKTTDLAALKSQLVEDLRTLDHRFIVTVDDVDRLEPAEVIEVLRLVRSVADFPNIIYILCYDAHRLAEAIQSGAKVANGAAYLEKIVQLTVMVPNPEVFELRQWFEEDLVKLVGQPSEQVRERLKTIIDQEGGIQLRTPRSVVRTLDSIRFIWPAVRDLDLDAADLVWLQLIKDGSPKLYRWLESYLASEAAISFGTASVTEASKAERTTSLIEACPQGQLADIMYRHMFAEQLPGIEASYGEDEPPVKIHQKVRPNDRQVAIDGRRLASPDHYKMYFSLAGPSFSIPQHLFDRFWSATDTGVLETAEVLRELYATKAFGVLRKSDVLFQRLRYVPRERWSGLRAQNMLLALGEIMDDAYRSNPDEQFFIVTSWDRAEPLIPILYASFDDAERQSVNEQLFSNASAIGWLTSILRHETFAHGRFGNKKKSEIEWLLPAPEFERACDIMIARYAAMSIDDVLATPRPIQTLFAWLQAGDEDRPKALISAAINTDEGLLRVLDGITSRMESSNRGRYVALKRENVESFLDYDEAIKRLEIIAREGPPELRLRAEELLRAVEADDH